MKAIRSFFEYLTKDETGHRELVAYEVFGERLREVYQEETRDWIGRIQQALRVNGVEKGDRVVLLASNSSKWVAADVAIMALGAVCVPLYERQSLEEILFMVQDAQAKCLIASNEDLLKELRADCATVKCLSFEEVLKTDFSEPHLVEVKDQDLASLVYTSGTSGNPKGVQINHQNMNYMVGQTTNQLAKTVKAESNREKVYHFLPLCFMGSRIMAWTQLYRARPIYLSTDIQNLKVELQTVNPHYYLNVPAILERIKTGVEAALEQKGKLIAGLYARAKKDYFAKKSTIFTCLAQKLIFRSVKKQVGSDLEFLICGSAPLQEDTQRWFFMMGIPVLQVYGLTETTAIISMDDLDSVRPGYVGKLIPGVESKLTQDGELWVRSPGVFPGYWEREEENEAIFENAWLKTGDQVEIDSGGRLKVLGRVKNIIVSESGHNIVPEPIEEKLRSYCPKLEQVMVVGHGRPFLTAIVTGKVKRSEVEDAIAAINQDLPHYRRIKKFQILENEFTAENGLLTANHKLKRKKIERQFMEPIQAMYSGANKQL